MSLLKNICHRIVYSQPYTRKKLVTLPSCSHPNCLMMLLVVCALLLDIVFVFLLVCIVCCVIVWGCSGCVANCLAMRHAQRYSLPPTVPPPRGSYPLQPVCPQSSHLHLLPFGSPRVSKTMGSNEFIVYTKSELNRASLP